MTVTFLWRQWISASGAVLDPARTPVSAPSPAQSGMDPIERNLKTDVEFVAVVVARLQDLFDRQLEQMGEVRLRELIHDRAGHRGQFRLVPEGQVHLLQDESVHVAVDSRDRVSCRLDGKATFLEAPDPGVPYVDLLSVRRGTGTDMSTQAIANDIAGADRSVQRDTIASYLDILNRLMITEDLPAWAPHMRSATPLRKSPTRFMTGPSLEVAALGVGPEQLLLDLNATGFHFESLVVRDLRIYAQPIGGHLSHWRDNNRHEVDIIITLDDGRWGALEVKMNPYAIAAAAASLLRFKDKVETARTGEPAFLAVTTTRSAAVRRGDGAYVLPVASLGP